MKYVFYTASLLLFTIFQPTLFQTITFFGTVPNLFLIYLVCVCCYLTKKEGCILGFATGLVLDLLVGKVIGINAVLMMILAFFITSFFENVIRNNTLLITLLLVFLTTFFYEAVYYIVTFLGDLHLGTIIIKILLPESFYSLIVAIPFYFAIKKFAKNFLFDKGEGLG